MQSSHFYLFKAFANCFHTFLWKGGSNTSFGLIKGKFIIFHLPILNCCKSSRHAHQLWYQAQTILTKDFIVVTAYKRLPLTHSLWVHAVQQQLIKHFST